MDAEQSNYSRNIRVNAPRSSSAVDVVVDEHGTTIISPEGDLMLVCRAQEDAQAACFQVSSKALKEKSRYFERLLTDTRFSEGRALAQHQAVKGSLPRVEVVDVGRISPVKSITPLMTDLLLLLHYGHLKAKKVPLVNLANLATAADRFDASEALSYFLKTTSVLVRPKAVKGVLDETSVRQRLLIGLLTGDRELVLAHSRDLVLFGSSLWRKDIAPDDALWWDLPRDIEEELRIRHDAIIETIWSLMNACLTLYTSRIRQCRLGYDTSPACDSFQLGEFVRFLARSVFLQFTSSLAPSKAFDEQTKGIPDIIAGLRSCPAYQLDANHSHCGPRKQLTAGLNFIESRLSDQDIGVHLDSWNDRRNLQRSWSQGNKALTFNVTSAARDRRDWTSVGTRYHADGALQENSARQFFTAAEKVWEAEPGAHLHR